MKLAVVANNIEGNYDGIGKHARLLADAMQKNGIDISFYSGTTWNKKKRELFYSFEMSKAFLRLIKDINEYEYDYVLIEYPFIEYNPLILIALLILFVRTRFSRTRIALSLHEYNRVNKLRKLAIIGFLALSDFAFYTNKEYCEKFRLLERKSYTRFIPGHINCPQGEKDYSNRRFSYFGLINGSKAFEEMLQAWKCFNKEKKYQLDIATCSPCNIDDYRKYNVFLHSDLPDADVAEMLFNSSFTIIPSKPNIALNNGSFMAATLCGSIPIGVLSDVVKSEGFSIGSRTYGLSDFVDSLQHAVSLSNEDVKNLSVKAHLFGKQYSFDKLAKEMISVFENFER